MRPTFGFLCQGRGESVEYSSSERRNEGHKQNVLTAFRLNPITKIQIGEYIRVIGSAKGLHKQQRQSLRQNIQ